MDLTWNKGKLSNMRKGTLKTGTRSHLFTYNGFGQRVRKTYTRMLGTSEQSHPDDLAESIQQYYYDHSGRLIAETCSKTYFDETEENYRIVYLYDESSIIGMVYIPESGNAQLYYFQRNLLGDVVGIFDTSGGLVARYLYDAWGNCTIAGDTTNNALAHANPIRYRGYYYDDDTGLYYCNARYYSPKWRRFISPDDTAYLDPESVNGLNRYCYCNNDPVNYSDPSGRLAVLTILVGCLIAFGVGAATSVVSQGFQYGWDNISVGQMLLDGAVAAFSVALAATGIPFAASVGIGAAMGLGQYAAASAFHNESMTIQGAIIATVLGGLGGAISGEGAKSLKALSKIYDGMTGRAASGFKALITAAQRYGLGSKQVGLVNNLYGKAIQTAVNQGIHKAFVISARNIMITTILTPVGSAGIDLAYGLMIGA